MSRSQPEAQPEAPPELSRSALQEATRRIGRAAVAALYDELALAPKPGLVSFADSGSHRDMDARTFMRSLFALRHSFARLAALGAAGADFTALADEGLRAEQVMLTATGGINTHRGAIFSLGLLCASAGWLRAQGARPAAARLRQHLLAHWSPALARRPRGACRSHGASAAEAHGLRGANAEAALGLPVLFETTWPALQAAIKQGLPMQAAQLQAFFATLACLDDTNLAHRGGLAGLRWAQAAAHTWLQGGGAARPGAVGEAWALHREFVARRLSPGGSADMLAAACWLQRLEALP